MAVVACPKCRRYMFPGRHGGTTLDLCSGCHGIWLDRGELASIAATAADLPEPQVPLPSRFGCPRCGTPLEERPYSGRSGLRVDVCASCRGVYLDKGEILMIEDLAKGVNGAFPPERRDRLQRKAARREALSAVYRTAEPAAVVFAGYILYDTSNILLKYRTDELVSATLDLYLDIVNFFLDMLRILTYLKRH